ncbi:MAG TPA: cytochrome c [Polyangiaceae bacterium]|nr:cytochrome c [Polyangiaceae bacterium]
MIRVLLLACALALVLTLGGCRSKSAVSTAEDPKLTFVRDGKTMRALGRGELVAKITPKTVEAFDPYYTKAKRFRALPMRSVLEAGFGSAQGLDQEQFVLRASDGYTVPVRGSLLLEDGAYLAYEDVDVPGWEPIGPQHTNPGPFYVIWSKPEQANLETYPRPWQLTTIEIARFDAIFPHTSPGPLPPDAPAERGYAIFRDRCIRCHAINREGGHVGPDLNVPQNVTEYRPEAQIRAYIKNPATFRYSNMPAHPDLTDAQLDELLAYLRAMKDRKHDER